MWLIASEQAMLDFGEDLGKLLRPGDLLFLSGELGAGKTTLTKGIAKGLEIETEITSPTFQLRKTYEGRFILNHLDLYRLERPAELAIFEPEVMVEEGVTVVEWGDLLKSYFPDYLEIAIGYGTVEGSRQLVIEPHGARFDERLKGLCNA